MRYEKWDLTGQAEFDELASGEVLTKFIGVAEGTDFNVTIHGFIPRDSQLIITHTHVEPAPQGEREEENNG